MMYCGANRRISNGRLAGQAAIIAALGWGAASAPAIAEGLFRNGENAAVVLGQKDFLSNVVATTRKGENGPSAVGFDSFGNLWVSDQCNSRMLEFKPPFHDDMKASVVIGEPNFTTTSSPQACFSGAVLPTNLPNIFSYNDKFTFDAAGDLWVADLGNNRVLEFVPPFSNGMYPSLVIGQTDFTSSVAATTANGLNFPTEPQFDAVGNLWVADINNNRVLEYLPPFTNGMDASLVIGQQDFKSNACATTRNGSCSADSIVFDTAGSLWVADAFGNNRVLQFQPPFSTGMNASRVIGQKDFVSNTPGVGRSGLNFFDGSGLTVDSFGNLWVGDSGNNRTLEFPNEDGVVSQRAAQVIGQSNFQANGSATSRNGMWIPFALPSTCPATSGCRTRTTIAYWNTALIRSRMSGRSFNRKGERFMTNRLAPSALFAALYDPLYPRLPLMAAAIGVALCSLGMGVPAIAATITTFDAPGAGTQPIQGTYATSINAKGAIAGYFLDSSSVSHGFVRAADGTITPFDPSGSLGTHTTSISPDIFGTAVSAGYFNDYTGTHSFLRTFYGNILAFDCPGSTDTEAYSINGGGAVTGFYYDSSNVSHGFVRWPNEIIWTIDPPGSLSTIALGVNNDLSIVGSYYDGAVSHGFVRYRNETITTFDVSGSLYTVADSINAKGAIAGSYQDSTGNSHAFVRATDGTITTFDPSGSLNTYTSGIDNSGSITGTYQDAAGAFHGFVRKPHGRITTIDPSGSVGTFAESIAGGKVAGYYEDSGFVVHGFVRSR